MAEKMKRTSRWIFLLSGLILTAAACADSGEKNSTEKILETNSTDNTMGFDLSAMDYEPDTDAQSFF